MKERRNLLLAIGLFLATILNAQTNKIVGYYCGNFAVIGFFNYQMKFDSNLTFKYQFAGDLFNDVATGNYKVIKDTIFLEFKPDIIDTTMYLKGMAIKKNQYADSRRKKILIKGNKLYFVELNGKVIKKRPDYKGKIRKYYLQYSKDQVWKDW